MSHSEKFSLRWNDFQQNVSQTFGKLRNEIELCDVTLVSGDNQQISAHKVVLSACSEFFKNIFKKNIHSNPLIFLDNVSFSDLKLILDYIYLGEVQIFQDDLDSFLLKAQKLKLEGLQTAEDEAFIPPVLEEKEFNIKDNYCQESYEVESDASKIGTLDSIKSRKSRSYNFDNKLFPIEKTTIEVENNLEVESKFQELVRVEAGTFVCTVCNKTMTHRFSMKRHVETHINGLSYNCTLCDKTFRSSHSYNRHRH